MNQVRHWIGFEENMDRLGDRDQPVGVCILDSGVEAHPDFGKRIVLFRDFVEERQGLYDDPAVDCVPRAGIAELRHIAI